MGEPRQGRPLCGDLPSLEQAVIRLSPGILRSLEFGPALGDCQSVDGKVFGLAMNCQVEPLGQQLLQHASQLHAGGMSAFRQFRFYVVALGGEAFRSAGDLEIVDVVGLGYQDLERSVGRRKAAPAGGGRSNRACPASRV